MRQVSWQRFVAALHALGCEPVLDAEHMISLSFRSTLVFRVRKISPVTIGLQERTIAAMDVDRTAYLAALAGSGPAIEE